MRSLQSCVQPQSLVAAAETAGPSTALRFGRDDNSVAGWSVSRFTYGGCHKIVIPTEVEGPAVLPSSNQSKVSHPFETAARPQMWVGHISLVFGEMWEINYSPVKTFEVCNAPCGSLKSCWKQTKPGDLVRLVRIVRTFLHQKLTPSTTRRAGKAGGNTGPGGWAGSLPEPCA
jgi:hypothetical protein